MEPWLSGKHADLDPFRRLLVCSLEQSLADLRKWTPLEPDERICFHLRHIAGSVDRLFTYATGGQLGEEQLAYLRSEASAGGTREELLEGVAETFAEVERGLRMMEDLDFREPRFIGRQRLETPLGVLLGHIAEHTQRHTGQVIERARGLAEQG